MFYRHKAVNSALYTIHQNNNMKKALTVILIVFVSLLVAFLIGGLFGPKTFKMERSVDINAPRDVIYKNISDYRNWKKWSPWVDIDSNCKYEYYGTQGQIGAGYKWKGNGKVGEGDMHTTDMVYNKNLTAPITFVKPMPSIAIVGFKLEDGDNGGTKVTWSFTQSYSFMQRPFMLVMNLAKMIGPDYERGLAKLKEVCENSVSALASLEVKEVVWAEHTYLADRSTIDIKNVDQIFQDKMPKTFDYLQKNNFQMAGPPSGLFFTWDTNADSTDLAIAIPVKDASMASGDYTAITIGRSRALMVDFYGSYDRTDIAHDAIKKYIKEKKLIAKSPAIEEYVTDPATEKDPNKVLTKVYYLID